MLSHLILKSLIRYSLILKEYPKRDIGIFSACLFVYPMMPPEKKL
jgi:hypothetical protein